MIIIRINASGSFCYNCNPKYNQYSLYWKMFVFIIQKGSYERSNNFRNIHQSTQVGVALSQCRKVINYKGDFCKIMPPFFCVSNFFNSLIVSKLFCSVAVVKPIIKRYGTKKCGHQKQQKQNGHADQPYDKNFFLNHLFISTSEFLKLLLSIFFVHRGNAYL